MSLSKPQVTQCTCGICSLGVEHPQQALHCHINLLMSKLNEQQRRWLASILAEYYGLDLRGIYLVTQITGLSDKTIRKGLKELEHNLENMHLGGIRRPGAGRPRK